MREFSVQLTLALTAQNFSVIFKMKYITISRITILESFIYLTDNLNFPLKIC